MTTVFFPKLAWSNIKKNKKTYIPYIFTCIITVAMFYIIKSLSVNPNMTSMFGGNMMAEILTLGCWVIALFAAIFLFYTNSFLVKRRKKEFGIFNILGMEKRHLAVVLAWETLYVLCISLTAGLIMGVALDKVMFLLISKIVGSGVALGFFISLEAIQTTILLFAVIFGLILCNSAGQVHVSEPMELLRDGKAGEKEPKTKWLMTIFGIVCIGIGYYLAITVKDPVMVIIIFFIAVILVIIGTYLLFTAGSIALLKLLRKNKGYYYKTRHFISVSGMIYRMKQNAVGLANICILSTMVLVMVSSTSSLMVGMEDIIASRYPYDISVYSHITDETDQMDDEENKKLIQVIQQMQNEYGIKVKNEVQYLYLEFSVYRENDTFVVDRNNFTSLASSIEEVLITTLSDYNAMEGENKTLRDGEILIYSNRSQYQEPVVKLLGKEYQVAERLEHFTENGLMDANISETHCIVVPDRKDLEEICKKQQEALGDRSSNISMYYGFHTDAKEEIQKNIYQSIREYINARQIDKEVYTESKAAARIDFYSLYGGLFFIGIFLAVLFVMATVLIIYYKQISEGYDDKERFTIMQKVGMSRAEVKASIHSQVLTVFFLPLIVAGIHVAAAFPMISRMLELLNCTNTKLYIICMAVSFLIFSVMYAVIYLLTAKNYYHIVSNNYTADGLLF